MYLQEAIRNLIEADEFFAKAYHLEVVMNTDQYELVSRLLNNIIRYLKNLNKEKSYEDLE